MFFSCHFILFVVILSNSLKGNASIRQTFQIQTVGTQFTQVKEKKFIRESKLGVAGPRVPVMSGLCPSLTLPLFVLVPFPFFSWVGCASRGVTGGLSRLWQKMLAAFLGCLFFTPAKSEHLLFDRRAFIG